LRIAADVESLAEPDIVAGRARGGGSRRGPTTLLGVTLRRICHTWQKRIFQAQNDRIWLCSQRVSATRDDSAATGRTKSQWLGEARKTVAAAMENNNGKAGPPAYEVIVIMAVIVILVLALATTSPGYLAELTQLTAAVASLIVIMKELRS
jgi:hypothetical protein